MKAPAPIYILALLLVSCLCVATIVDPESATIGGRDRSDSLLKVLLGDGRQIFANHFFEKADVYFHSGYYPSYFEQSYNGVPTEKHFAQDHHDHHEGDEDHDHHDDHHDGEADHDEHGHDHEHEPDFLGKSRDWIDGFGRHFYSAHHSHLDKPGAAREILPWLKISAELDPHRIETYTVAAYWLRSNMKKSHEAEEFLREGLKANPMSYEILFDLGQIYELDRHDPDHARNLWELALQRWDELEAQKKDPNPVSCDEIAANLAHLEDGQTNYPAALHYLELELKYTPSPEAVKKQIDEMKQKISAQPASQTAHGT